MGKKVLTILIGVIITSVLLYLLFAGEKKFKWTESYKIDDKEPYGSYVISELLKDYKQDFTVLRNNLYQVLPKGKKPANYIFIGERLTLTDRDADSLLAFIFNGNTAFISSGSLPGNFVKRIYNGHCGQWDNNSFMDSMVYLNFKDKNLKNTNGYKFNYVIENKSSNYYWVYTPDSILCDSTKSFQTIGYITSDSGSKANFLKLNFGKGIIYIHQTPLAFSNYHLLRREAIAYASKSFSHLNEGEIYWDEFSKFPANFNKGEEKNYSSPLQFILSQKSLKWAWYFFLITILLYILFRAKRKQNIIPVTEPNANSSLEFIDTIGDMYWQQRSHKKIILKKMKYFLYYVKKQYNLSLQQADEGSIKKLSVKSQVPFFYVSIIFAHYKDVKSSEFITDEEFMEFHNSLNKFYKNCK